MPFGVAPKAVQDIDGHPVKGWVTVLRGHLLVYHGESVVWYVENGMKAWEVFHEHDRIVFSTNWDFHGRVTLQILHGTFRRTPPWLWGVTDQTEPTAPWWEEG